MGIIFLTVGLLDDFEPSILQVVQLLKFGSLGTRVVIRGSRDPLRQVVREFVYTLYVPAPLEPRGASFRHFPSNSCTAHPGLLVRLPFDCPESVPILSPTLQFRDMTPPTVQLTHVIRPRCICGRSNSC